MALIAAPDFEAALAGIRKGSTSLSVQTRRAKARDEQTAPLTSIIISELQSDQASQARAQRNIQDGRSLLAEAEGGLNAIASQLDRLRELAVRGAGETISERERAALNAEANTILDEISRQASVSNFNGQKLLNGDLAGGLQVHVGSEAEDNVTVILRDSRSAALGMPDRNYLSDAGDARTFLGIVDDARQRISEDRSAIGAMHRRLDSIEESLKNTLAVNEAAQAQRLDETALAAQASQSNESIAQEAGAGLLARALEAGRRSLDLIG